MKGIGPVLEKGLSGKARGFIAFSLLALLVSIFSLPSILDRPHPSLRTERLLEEIRHGLRPEMAKLLFITERYRDSDFKVIFDGMEYRVNEMLSRARTYLARNYRGEPAERWIRTHLYRSSERGEVIYLKAPDGSRRPLRDVFLEELENLPLA